MRAREIDMIDPTALAARWRGRELAWLDGDATSPQGRWSFLGCEPIEVREARFGEGAPFAVLRELGPSESAGPLDPALVPRWIGHVAYDACWSAGRAIGLRRGPKLVRAAGTPVLRFARYDAVVAIDGAERRAWIVGDDDDAVARALEKLRAPGPSEPPCARVGSVLAEPAAVHRAAIERALEHIAAGEIYQVNLARRWTGALEGDALALFLAMRRASPVPFGAFVEAGEQTLLARTMERFLRWDARTGAIETRPIKGTIARSGEDDRGEAARLRADDKERAEHAMIVDLMRNDLGRIAQIGSVRVERALEVEPYAGLSHLVSTVRAVTRAGVELPELLEATFPPGSISGTPKLRAIEIIEALERHPRGAYCGAIGHVDRAGGVSLAVAIRTATVRDGELEYFAGGGLVEASVPEREVAETELKARVLLDAVRALDSETACYNDGSLLRRRLRAGQRTLDP